jgi:hypothetical protein
LLLKGRRFNDINMIQDKLQDIPGEFWTESISKCFQKQYNCWVHCIKS